MSARHDRTVELLQELIRQRAVNDGTPSSGQEMRSVEVVRRALEGSGLRHEIVEPAPGRGNLVGRVPGSDPGAPSLLLVGHLDVVPVDERGWSRDPFGGELVDGYVWGRGAIDMLGLTAAFTVVAAEVAAEGGLRGDLVLATVADEEAGGRFGVRWLAEHRPDLLAADYALTENGGILVRGGDAPRVTLTVGEKSGVPRRLRVHGTPGHGSTPWGGDNAAVAAARVLERIATRPGPATITPQWRAFVAARDLPRDLAARLVDERTLNDALAELGPLAAYAHAMTHVTVSPNVVRSGDKLNVIPSVADIDLDVRALPQHTSADVDAVLAALLEGLPHRVDVLGEGAPQPSVSPEDTAATRAIAHAVRALRPGAELVPVVMPGGTDAKHLRRLGTDCYGFGLFSDAWDLPLFRSLFHGDDERIDVASLALTVDALRGTVDHLLG